MSLNRNLFIFGFGVLVMEAGNAHGPLPMPLQDVPVPTVPGLLLDATHPDPIVVNKEKAIALGKALFWDTNVGSDGMACGSCHFHAGADRRVQNQINPGGKSHLSATAQTFELAAPDHKLNADDFPTYRFDNPFDNTSSVIFSTDDVVSSSGTFSGQFTGASKLTGMEDQCARAADPVFHLGSIGTRKVEPRNAPSVINSIFNYRNFWDGRANNVFNGVNNWGDRDPNPIGVWVKTGARSVSKQRLHLTNSSLASLSVAPPLNDAEMSCQQRDWPSIGRKLLLRQPLQNQQVHPQDSVLGAYSLSGASELKNGLNLTYRTMVQQAFNNKYWSYSGAGPFGAPSSGTPYNQMEANFSMFFGIALQMYQATLVSDQAPIDLSPRDPASMEPTWEGLGKSAAEIEQLKEGLNAFVSNHCNLCHAGPNLTTATIDVNSTLVTATTPTSYYGPSHFRIPYGANALGTGNGAAAAAITPFKNVVDRRNLSGAFKLVDVGFANTGVNDPLADMAIGGVDDFNNPLSFADQYVQYLLGNSSAIKDSVVATTRACDFTIGLAVNSTLVSSATITKADGTLEIDGNREGVLRDQNCLSASRKYIPTVTTANNVHVNKPTKLATSTAGTFKIPGLRNIELTGPYMHNGSMATLEQVIEFYSRLGNFNNPNKDNLVNNITLAGYPPARDAIIALLKSFTDERVRYEKAPFDHPQIKVPHGHADQFGALNEGNFGSVNLAKDQYLEIPAVGANGADTPLPSFADILEQ